MSNSRSFTVGHNPMSKQVRLSTEQAKALLNKGNTSEKSQGKQLVKSKEREKGK